MKKKSILILVASVVVTAAVAVGGTIAYFTAQDTAVNTFTVGNVSIDLDEANVKQESDNDINWVEDEDADRITDGGASYTNIIPGSVIYKDPTITVGENSEDCYVRFIVTCDKWAEFSQNLTKEEKADIINTFAVAGVDTTKFDYKTVGNSFVITCKDVLSASSVATAFTGFTVPATLNNEEFAAINGDTGFKITVEAQAIQAKGLPAGTTYETAFDNFDK